MPLAERTQSEIEARILFVMARTARALSPAEIMAAALGPWASGAERNRFEAVMRALVAQGRVELRFWNLGGVMVPALRRPWRDLQDGEPKEGLGR